jgi:hypothetical protein
MKVIPTHYGLMGLVGKKIQLDQTLGCQPIGNGVIVKGYGAALDLADNTVSIVRDDAGGAGLWVPYAETKAVVGYMTGSQIWVASGPFSGCQFAVGKNRKTGIVFGAHIAQQSGSTAGDDYRTYRTENDLSEWYFNKVPMPNQLAFSCSYVFVVCGDGGINHMARIDVDVTKMGGSDGTIRHAHQFK